VTERKGGKGIDKTSWHIYVGQIPHSEKGDFWVSFESKPDLEKTKANIYGGAFLAFSTSMISSGQGH